ncbi:hypothetical protein JOF56_004233 [Kibdelosporangium banguiense]|uniref:DUF3558 domain-containing protein n=1 Tax=Kibdelosporangium banguiense TaxID=1365924 RepID=A0ABS4THC9_9PSEU|nr:hypothetical protein [Kibdelosporangium banguiense]MBP2323848.1 hypothetical protein [Kibdelosporangium banguiense]
MRTRLGILGSALILCLTACTSPDPGGRQPLNTDKVTDAGPEICSLLPKQAIAHLTARAEENLTAVGDLPVGPDTDRGQCDVLVSEGESRQTVARLRIDTNQAGAVVRVNEAIQIAQERGARTPLPNPLRKGNEAAPSISLAIKCGNRPVQIGIDITGYDTRRNTVDADLADLSGVVASKYGGRLGCRSEVAPPLEEEQRGNVLMKAGNGDTDVPSGPSPGPSASIGLVEAITTAPDGTVYFVGRKYSVDVSPRSVEGDTAPWGQSLRILRIRTDGVVEVAWDPNLAPFSVNASPVPGDIPEKLRLQGRDTLGAVSALTLHKDQVWLVPTNATSKQAGGTLSRPVRIVQLNGGRAVDLRAIKAPNDADSSRIKDPAGRPIPNSIDLWNESQFSAVSFDGETPVLLDSAHARVWRVDALRDGKILDATVFPAVTQIAAGSSTAALTGGRFAVSTPQGGISVLNSRGQVPVGFPTVSAQIDGVGLSPLELGRRQLAGAGDDILVHAMTSQINAPAVVRVNSKDGTARTIQVSGYPGSRDPSSNVDTTRFARTFGTAANATRLFATGWPVSALGAVGQNILMAPFGARILYELVPRR